MTSTTRRNQAVAVAMTLTLFLSGGAVTATPASAASVAGVLTTFAVPTAGSGPAGIAAGSDGSLWFTENLGNGIGRITPTGEITEFPLPQPNSKPSGIAAGTDGNMWFTTGNAIGRITLDGEISEFSLPSAGSGPEGIAAGPDGNMWFTERYHSQIGRITPTGEITEYLVPDYVLDGVPQPRGIAAGPDGNLWFTDYDADMIGRITVDGEIDLFWVGITPGSNPWHIAAGPDGNMWFTEFSGSRIGRITVEGEITELTDVMSPDSHPVGIAAGADGNMWFTRIGGNGLSRIAPTEQVSHYPAFAPFHVAVGPDGHMWFTGFDANSIGRITSDFPLTERHAALSGTGQVGLPLVCAADIWGPQSSFTITWQRNGAPLPGRTGLTYSPVDSDLGATITCTSNGILPAVLTALPAVSNPITVIPQATGPTGPTGPQGPAGAIGSTGPPGPAGPAGASAPAPLVAVFAPGPRARTGTRARIVYAVSQAAAVTIRLAKRRTVLTTTDTAAPGTNTARLRLTKAGADLRPGKYPLTLLGPDREALATTTLTVTR